MRGERTEQIQDEERELVVTFHASGCREHESLDAARRGSKQIAIRHKVCLLWAVVVVPPGAPEHLVV